MAPSNGKNTQNLKSEQVESPVLGSPRQDHNSQNSFHPKRTELPVSPSLNARKHDDAKAPPLIKDELKVPNSPPPSALSALQQANNAVLGWGEDTWVGEFQPAGERERLRKALIAMNGEICQLGFHSRRPVQDKIPFIKSRSEHAQKLVAELLQLDWNEMLACHMYLQTLAESDEKEKADVSMDAQPAKDKTPQGLEKIAKIAQVSSINNKQTTN